MYPLLAMSPMPSLLHGTLEARRLSPHTRALPLQGRRSPLMALWVAFCLLMPLGPGGGVLCLGADGHIAFEPARNSRCTTPIAPAVTPSPQITSGTSPPNHCGACIDALFMTSDAASQRFSPIFPLVVPLAMSGCAFTPWVASDTSPSPCTPCWLSPSRVTHTTLSALRTVMLLV